jgi:hypothetical protein
MELTGIKLKYHSPAYPPKDIQTTWIYELGITQSGKSYVFDGNLIQYLDLETIKILFYPLNHNNWFEVDRYLKQGKK